MKYEEALAFLKSREQFHVKVGTRNIRLLARALGHPEHRFPSVVVAGTNGKGSTVAILDSILRAHGLRVGRFTSPHLVSIGERILVNGRQLPDGEFAGLIHDIARAAERLPPDQQPSFFETITGAAFLAFARHEVDVAAFEVGMGGRWDATTATDAPLGLVTRIALDHERYLGRTVREIAGEKGAVARPGGELLIARQDSAAAEVLAACARDRGARVRDVAQETTLDCTVHRTGAAGTLSTPVATYDDLWLPCPAGINWTTWRSPSGERSGSSPGRGSEPSTRFGSGTASRRSAGRDGWNGCPADGTRPRLLLDAAHNPSGAERLSDYLDTLGANGRRVLVFGASRDKRVEEMLAPLAPHFERVLLTTAATRRALPIADLKDSAERVFAGNGTRAETVEDVPQALTKAFRLAGRQGEVVIAGSIFLLGDALRLLRAEKGHRFDQEVIEMPVLPPEPAGRTGTERRSSAA